MHSTDTVRLAFDHDLCVGVASFLNREHGLAAEVEEYEIGMSTVRMNPTDGAESGFLATPGAGEDSQSSWFLTHTERWEHPQTGEAYFQINENVEAINLRLDLNSPLDAVAKTVAQHIKTIRVFAAFADLITAPTVADGTLRAAIARANAYKAAGIDPYATTDAALGAEFGNTYVYCTQHVRPADTTTTPQKGLSSCVSTRAPAPWLLAWSSSP